MSKKSWDDKLQEALYEWRKPIVWLILLSIATLLAIHMQELFLLVLMSYGLALLLDPIVSRMTGKRVSRSSAVLLIGLVFVLAFLFIIAFAFPAIARQYNSLIDLLPSYLTTAYENINGVLLSLFGWGLPSSFATIVENARQYVSAISSEQIKSIGSTLIQTLLSGYSWTLTIINLLMVPLFVYYLTRDLGKVHRFLGSFLNTKARHKTAVIGNEILEQVYAFIKGQLTVALIMAVCYIIGFSIIGLPFAIVVGTITGLLGIIPYLGSMVGIVLSTVLTIVSDFSWWDLAQVFIVFGINNIIEGIFVTPKIVGEKIGIHPLAVMVALIIGGQLFGIVGLIIALPTFAAIRVLLKHLFADLDIQD
ncbi:MAG: AI-2E family transporter [Deltaproteobacteria bacterium]|nr:AI-2E family transporter [Deltaproteobacteria bacterium]